MTLENEDFNIKVKRLKIFLDPKRSKLRPYLALFGIKNYLLLKNGSFINNNPSIKWYVEQLARAGVSENYWGIRRQLIRMAKVGIFHERKALRPVDNSFEGNHRITRIQLSEFYLNEKLYPALDKALREIFQVEDLSILFIKKNLGDLLCPKKGRSRQASKRTRKV
jgi:hypothetical protein